MNPTFLLIIIFQMLAVMTVKIIKIIKSTVLPIMALWVKSDLSPLFLKFRFNTAMLIFFSIVYVFFLHESGKLSI